MLCLILNDNKRKFSKTKHKSILEFDIYEKRERKKHNSVKRLLILLFIFSITPKKQKGINLKYCMV